MEPGLKEESALFGLIQWVKRLQLSVGVCVCVFTTKQESWDWYECIWELLDVFTSGFPSYKGLILQAFTHKYQSCLTRPGAASSPRSRSLPLLCSSPYPFSSTLYFTSFFVFSFLSWLALPFLLSPSISLPLSDLIPPLNLCPVRRSTRNAEVVNLWGVRSIKQGQAERSAQRQCILCRGWTSRAINPTI